MMRASDLQTLSARGAVRYAIAAFAAIFVLACGDDDGNPNESADEASIDVVEVRLSPAGNLPAGASLVGTITNRQVLAYGPMAEPGTLVEASLKVGCAKPARRHRPIPGGSVRRRTYVTGRPDVGGKPVLRLAGATGAPKYRIHRLRAVLYGKSVPGRAGVLYSTQLQAQ